MTLSQEQVELIEAYLANELSAADRQAFEQDIADDPAMQAELQTQRAMRLGLQALAIEQRLQRARQRVAEQANSTKGDADNQPDAPVKPLIGTKQAPRWGYWAAAASVVIGLGFGLGVYWYQHQPAPELAYLDPATTDQLTKSLPADLRPTDRQRIIDAIRGYKAGQYDKVVEQLRIPSADRRTVYYQHYFLGLGLLARKQYADAIAPLEAAQASLSLPLRQKASWFLAVAYLKNGEKEKALPILDAIRTDKAHPYHTLAEQVYLKNK